MRIDYKKNNVMCKGIQSLFYYLSREAKWREGNKIVKVTLNRDKYITRMKRGGWTNLKPIEINVYNINL